MLALNVFKPTIITIYKLHHTTPPHPSQLRFFSVDGSGVEKEFLQNYNVSVTLICFHLNLPKNVVALYIFPLLTFTGWGRNINRGVFHGYFCTKRGSYSCTKFLSDTSRIIADCQFVTRRTFQVLNWITRTPNHPCFNFAGVVWLCAPPLCNPRATAPGKNV